MQAVAHRFPIPVLDQPCHLCHLCRLLKVVLQKLLNASQRTVCTVCTVIRCWQPKPPCIYAKRCSSQGGADPTPNGTQNRSSAQVRRQEPMWLLLLTRSKGDQCQHSYGVKGRRPCKLFPDNHIAVHCRDQTYSNNMSSQVTIRRRDESP